MIKYERVPWAKRLSAELEPLFRAAKAFAKSRSQTAPHKYLVRVYRLFRKWKENGLPLHPALRTAKLLGIPVRVGSHPLRVLIDATSRLKDRKIRSIDGRAHFNMPIHWMLIQQT